MKQAGVITFYDHPNYGAMLQAYGLKCALEELGCAVTYIRPLVRMKNRNSRIFSFMESMGEEPAEEENRQGLFRLKGSGDREYWEEADARLDELRNTGLTYLRNIIDSRPEDMRRK